MGDKITIFKEVFDYYYDGEITKEQLADLLLMHYETRWGDGVDIKEIEDKDLRMIWRTLQHSVIKSAKNAKQYEKQQNKKSALQEITSTEFDIPKTEDKIDDNIEDEIKAILSPSNIKEVEQPQPIRDNASEGLKMAKNEVKQSVPLRITASEDFRPTEKLQELINTDDDFCSIYNRCINYIADYKLNPGDFVKSNSKNISFSKLQRIFEEYGIPFNENIKDFINNDVNAKIARLEKIA